METFNEIITLAILYLLMNFTDYQTSLEVQRDLAFIYIGVMILFTVVYCLIIGFDSYKQLIL